MSLKDLHRRQREAEKELGAVAAELNTDENRRRAYRFIQAMRNTTEMLGEGYVWKLELTKKGNIRAVIPWWGDHGDAFYYFSRRILEDDAFYEARLAAMAARRQRRRELAVYPVEYAI